MIDPNTETIGYSIGSARLKQPEERVAWMQDGMVVIDVETTGLDSHRHSIIEYAAIDWQGNWIAGCHRMRPGREIDPKAMAVNGITVGGLDVREVGYFQAIEDLFAWLDERRESNGADLVVAGMNPFFDAGFLRAEWDYLYAGKRLRCPLGHRMYDLHTLARAYLGLFEDEVPKGLYSDALSRALDMEPEAQPHTAMRGAEWACDAFAKIHTNLLMMKGE